MEHIHDASTVSEECPSCTDRFHRRRISQFGYGCTTDITGHSGSVDKYIFKSHKKHS